MKFIYDQTPGMLYDFIKVITAGYNYDPRFHYKNNDLQLDSDPMVRHTFEYIWSGMDKNLAGLEALLLPHRDGESFISWKFGPSVWELLTPEAFISALRNIKKNELRSLLMKYYDADGRLTDAGIAADSKSPDKVFGFINSLQVSEKVKWELQCYFHAPEPVIEEICAVFEVMAARYEEIREQYAPVFRNIDKVMNERIAADKKKFFLLGEFSWLKEKADSGEYDLIAVTNTYIDEYKVVTIPEDRTLRIYLGMSYRKAKNTLPANESWDQLRRFFKILEDDIRFKIFTQLLDKELFLGELAEILGIAISTTAYHVDFFIQDRIINVRVSGKRVYYSINAARLEQLMKIFDISFKSVLNRLDHQQEAGH